MATIFSHGIAAAALGAAFPGPKPARFWIYGILCSMAPDADVIGFRFGVHYEDMLGHRGLTHSIAFAIALSALVTAGICARDPGLGWKRMWLYLFVATISHGILDAFTDGGLGVAFFAPFSNHRYFFPWNPIQVSPIGGGFFSREGIEVLKSEAVWIWLPAAVFAAGAWLARRAFAAGNVARVAVALAFAGLVLPMNGCSLFHRHPERPHFPKKKDVPPGPLEIQPMPMEAHPVDPSPRDMEPVQTVSPQ